MYLTASNQFLYKVEQRFHGVGSEPHNSLDPSHPGVNGPSMKTHIPIHEPPPVEPPEEGIVHYGPGDRPLCGNESPFAIYTFEPDQVAGCQDCLELVAEDLQDPNTHYGGYCLHCRREITATGSVEWRRVVRRPCPHFGRAGW